MALQLDLLLGHPEYPLGARHPTSGSLSLCALVASDVWAYKAVHPTRSEMPFAVLLLLATLAALAEAGGAGSAATTTVPAGSDLTLPVVFPAHEVTEDDAYLCTAVDIPDKPLKLVGIESTSDQRIVHHMLLFGERRVWACAQPSASRL